MNDRKPTRALLEEHGGSEVFSIKHKQRANLPEHKSQCRNYTTQWAATPAAYTSCCLYSEDEERKPENCVNNIECHVCFDTRPSLEARHMLCQHLVCEEEGRFDTLEQIARLACLCQRL